MNLKSEVRGIPILGGACALPRPRATARAPRELRGACIFSFCATARMHTVGVGGVAYFLHHCAFAAGSKSNIFSGSGNTEQDGPSEPVVRNTDHSL